jgi:hypothetical protein
MNLKPAKIAVYVLDACVFVVAAVLFFLFTIHAKMEVGEGGEALGWITAGSMVFLLLLFAFRLIFLSKKTKPELKAKLTPYYRILNQLHMPVGFLTLSLLTLHFALVFDFSQPTWVHFTTGYIIVGLLLVLSILGIAAKKTKFPAKKILTICHQSAVLLLIVVFIIHLVLK